jgi:hypothetical protein
MLPKSDNSDDEEHTTMIVCIRYQYHYCKVEIKAGCLKEGIAAVYGGRYGDKIGKKLSVSVKPKKADPGCRAQNWNMQQRSCEHV